MSCGDAAGQVKRVAYDGVRGTQRHLRDVWDRREAVDVIQKDKIDTGTRV